MAQRSRQVAMLTANATFQLWNTGSRIYRQLQAWITQFCYVLLRSDGRVVACGSNRYGQCDVPTLTDGLHYIPAAAGAGALNPAMLQSRLPHKSVALQSTPPHNPVVL